MPAIIGADGIETHVPISLNEKEMEKLHNSAKTIRKIAEELDLEVVPN